MSTTYKVVPGDTFEIISRKVYGYESKSTIIIEANPQAVEPLTVGSELFIPKKIDIVPKINPTDQNQVSLFVDDKLITYWESFQISLTMDSIDTVLYTAPFDTKLDGFKDIFKPMSFKDISVVIGDETIFKGVQVDVLPVIQPDRKTVEVSGYSTPGVLNDCTAPISSYPLEFSDEDLRVIADKIVRPFGISTVFDELPTKRFQRKECELGKKLFSFLTELAQHEGFVITNTAEGNLKFWKSKPVGQPVARLEQGQSPLINITPDFKPQDYYSHITGVDFIIVGYRGSVFTVKNDKLKTLRPFSFKTHDVVGAEVQSAVRAKAGRMMANAVVYSVEVSTWRDPQGNLWTPNTTITLLAPDAMIFNEYEFLIRNVDLRRDFDSEVAILELILPGSFNAEIPEVFPWEE